MPSLRRSAERDRRLPVAPLVIILVVLIVVSAVVSLTIGSEPLPMRGVLDTVGARITGEPGPDPTIDVIVWDLRAPRALLAIIVGAGLALAGSGMQTLVRNPLADPYLLGVSAGASVGPPRSSPWGCSPPGVLTGSPSEPWWGHWEPLVWCTSSPWPRVA